MALSTCQGPVHVLTSRGCLLPQGTTGWLWHGPTVAPPSSTPVLAVLRRACLWAVCEPCALLSMTPTPTAFSPARTQGEERSGPHTPALGSTGAWATLQRRNITFLVRDSRAVLKGTRGCHSHPHSSLRTQLNAWVRNVAKSKTGYLNRAEFLQNMKNGSAIEVIL